MSITYCGLILNNVMYNTHIHLSMTEKKTIGICCTVGTKHKGSERRILINWNRLSHWCVTRKCSMSGGEDKWIVMDTKK